MRKWFHWKYTPKWSPRLPSPVFISNPMIKTYCGLSLEGKMVKPAWNPSVNHILIIDCIMVQIKYNVYVYWKYHDISKHLQLSAQIPVPNIKATTPLEFSLPSKRLDPLQDLQGVLPSPGTLQSAGTQTWSKFIEIKRVRGVGFYRTCILVIIL